MSLVNQMLNGLESRQELLSGSHDSVFDDLCAVSEEELHSNAGDGLHRGTALFLAALLGIFAVSLLSTSQSLQQVASGKAPQYVLPIVVSRRVWRAARNHPSYQPDRPALPVLPSFR